MLTMNKLYISILFSLILGITFLISSCSAGEKVPTKQSGTTQSWVESKLEPSSTGESGDLWSKTLALARKEGKIILLSSAGSEGRVALSRAFQQKFGIEAEIIGGRGQELTQRVLMERRVGIYNVDAYISGLGTSLFFMLKPANAADPLEPYFILPQVKEPKNWWNGLGWIDDEHTSLAFAAYVLPTLGINSSMVRQDDIGSYKDLVSPKWKGKITMNDPTVTGTGQRFIGVLIEIMGLDYIKALAIQEPIIIRDQRQQIEWLAMGKYPLALTPKSDIFNEFVQAGAPVRRLPMSEGEGLTAGGGVVVVINKTPHPNSTRIFVNWLLDKEGQTVYSKSMGVQSRRLDVPTDHLDPSLLRQDGAKYIDQNRQEFLLREPEFSQIARDIFAAFLK